MAFELVPLFPSKVDDPHNGIADATCTYLATKNDRFYRGDNDEALG